MASVELATVAPPGVEDALPPLVVDAPSSGNVQAATSELPARRSILGIHKDNARKTFVGAGSFLLALNILGLPFMLPKLQRFIGAPFVPMKRHYVESLFGHMLPVWAAAARRKGALGASASASSADVSATPLRGLRLVDFGSGDGRIVLAASMHGMQAVGYELNPYLVWVSKLRALRSSFAAPTGSAEFRLANAWTADLRNADIVAVYGRTGDDIMLQIAKKCEAELPQHAVVVSHLFDIPGWERLLMQDMNGLKLYDLSRLRRDVVGVEVE